MKVRWNEPNRDVGVYNKHLGVWYNSPNMTPIEQAVGKYGITKVETNGHLVFCQNYKGLKSMVVVNKHKYPRWFRYFDGKWWQQKNGLKPVNIKSLPAGFATMLAALSL